MTNNHATSKATKHNKIVVRIGKPPREEIWQLCKRNHSYCPTHGKCPNILDFEFGTGVEKSKTSGIDILFYCKKCKAIKTVNLWNNCLDLCEVIKEIKVSE